MSAAVAASGPPVIREPFTLLPCPKKQVSTLDEEGCSERALLRADARVNALAGLIFRALPPSGRASFARGERSWLAYRSASCRAEAAKYAGGTVQPVAYVGCEIGRDRTHATDLASTLRILTHP